MWKWLMLAAALGGQGGCVRQHPADRPVQVEMAAGSPCWLDEAASGAVAFWRARGAGLTFDPGDDVLPIQLHEVQDREDGIVGVYWTIELGEKIGIWFDPYGERYTPAARACVMAHEMGHALGLRHVSVRGDLMSERASEPVDGECAWTDRDRAEYERATGMRPNI